MKREEYTYDSAVDAAKTKAKWSEQDMMVVRTPGGKYDVFAEPAFQRLRPKQREKHEIIARATEKGRVHVLEKQTFKQFLLKENTSDEERSNIIDVLVDRWPTLTKEEQASTIKRAGLDEDGEFLVSALAFEELSDIELQDLHNAMTFV